MLNIKWTCCVLELHSMYANAPICFFSSSPWQFQNSEEKNKVRNLQIGYTLNLCVLFQDTLFMGVPMTPCKVVVSWKRKGEYLFPIHTQMGQASEKGYIFFVVLCWMISFIKIQGFLFDSLIEDERFGTLDMLCQAMY